MLLLGYGTKVGLAPMHTWLPDAHSQAPAPVSALMSGVLLAVAFSVLLRFKVIIDAAAGPGYLRGLLFVAALLSLLVAASLMLGQRDAKRLLAYSSIEHMGVIAFAAAIGTQLAIIALLLQVLAHALGKTVAFLAVGELSLAEGTTRISELRGALGRRPALGGCIALAFVALLGFPPFALFAGELGVAQAGFAADFGWQTAAVFSTLLVATAALLYHGQRLLLGTSSPTTARTTSTRAYDLGSARCRPCRARGHRGDDLAAPRSPRRGGANGVCMNRPRRSTLDVGADELAVRFSALTADGYRLALVAGHDDETEFRVVYLLVQPGTDARVELVVRTDRTAPAVPSLSALSFPAGRFERELADLFGITPTGHTFLRRLVHHQHWPDDWHPLRHDAGPTPPIDETRDPFPFVEVRGPGVYEIPVGPVHAGLIEPGHFRFSVVGETIITMKARLWFVHKGIEELFEGRHHTHGVELAERISGDTAVGHNLAYCLALEDALGVEVPRTGQYLRALLLELERLYNHAADLGALANDVGYGIVNAHTLRCREELLRLNRRVTGHRLLRGGVVPGGAHVRELPDRAALAAVAADLAEIADLALANSTVADRFTGTSILTKVQGTDLGVLGCVARASGIDVDARRDHPFVDLADRLRVVVRSEGDVRARFCVRRDEVAASTELINWLIDQLDRQHGQSAIAPLPIPERPVSGVGITEGWRGTITHRVEIAPGGRLTRVKIVDPSFFNWPALPVALTDTIVPDFPLTNKSFNLSYAGNDL